MVIGSQIPSLESMASYEHLGNFVVSFTSLLMFRKTTLNTVQDDPRRKPTEVLGGKLHIYLSFPVCIPCQLGNCQSMPIYVRLGMHLVFCTLHDTVSISYIEDQLSKQSIKSGVQFDSQEGAQDRISSFIKTYRLESTLDELLEPDPKKYKYVFCGCGLSLSLVLQGSNMCESRTFNEFFTRPLKPGARPVDGPNDPSIITSAADCRLTCYNTVKSATTFWIKSRKFNLESLIADKSISDLPEFKDEASLAIFRLAPSDFHRFSSPVAGRIVSCKKLPGQYYTVNPQAVNMDVPVFTANRRDVALLHMKKPDGTEIPIVFVAVGALLVGSIVWTAKEGDAVEKVSLLSLLGSSLPCA